MRIDLKSFARDFRKKSWGGIWSIDGIYLSDKQARLFVMKAIAAGYETDSEVPDSLVREWLGISK